MRILAVSSDVKFSAIMSLLGIVLLTLIGAIGYMIRRFSTRVDNIEKALTVAVTSLEIITTEFKDSKVVLTKTVDHVGELNTVTAVQTRIMDDHTRWADTEYGRLNQRLDRLERLQFPKEATA